MLLPVLSAPSARISPARQPNARAVAAPAGGDGIPPHWQFERRTANRHRGAYAPASVSDDPARATSVPAPVLDCSDVGLCLEVGGPAARDTALWVRRPGATCWRAYRVRWCQREGGRWHVGCEADPVPPVA